MKKNLSLKHKVDYKSAMELLTSLLDKIQLEVVEEKEKKTEKSSWEHLINHNKSYARFNKIKLVKPSQTKFSQILFQRKSIRNFDPYYKRAVLKIKRCYSQI